VVINGTNGRARNPGGEMSTTYHTLTGVADVEAGPLSFDEALAALERAGGPAGPGWGWSVSHKDWFRHTVGEVLDLVADPGPLRVLCLDAPVVVAAGDAAGLRDAVGGLRAAIRERPAEFVRRTEWMGGTAEDVVAAMDRAATADIAKVDDDGATPAECFFRYLRQQEAAAAEAARSGRSLVTLTMS
jgi:hypothetical protein